MTDATGHGFEAIPGTGDVFRAEMENLKRSLPILAGLGPEIAHMRRTLYNAHLAEGFTEAQSLELCKSIAL